MNALSSLIKTRTKQVANSKAINHISPFHQYLIEFRAFIFRTDSFAALAFYALNVNQKRFRFVSFLISSSTASNISSSSNGILAIPFTNCECVGMCIFTIWMCHRTNKPNHQQSQQAKSIVSTCWNLFLFCHNVQIVADEVSPKKMFESLTTHVNAGLRVCMCSCA